MEIELSDVTKSYQMGEGQLTILSHVSALFESGKTHAVIGPSGIGKSTLLHLIARLDNISSGTVRIGNTTVSKLSEEQASLFRRKHIGMVFQFHHLLPEFSALENVMLPLLINGIDEEEARAEANRFLDRIDLLKRATHRPSQLSGGEQQRVAIARAVIGRPNVLLADEPTGNLDPHNAGGVSELLLELAKEVVGTLVVVTHSRTLAEQMDVQFEMREGGALDLL